MKRERSERGFTLYELLVSTLVVGVALLATMLVTSQMGSQLRGERGRSSGTDNARVAVDEVTRILRAAGSQTDQSRGQNRFVHAGPWTLGLNANLFPLGDEDADATPRAIDPDLENAAVPLDGSSEYTPPRAFETGAETIVLTVDSDRNGTVGTGDDADDEEEESDTPNDLVLKAFVYGSDGAANVVTNTGLALLRGPAADEDGMVPQPLFRYWVDDDNDGATPAVLHGDSDADGALSQAEIADLQPVPSEDLALIARVDVTATTEGEHAKAHNEWQVMESSVAFRNRQSTAARIMGVVFHDYNQSGVQEEGEVPLSGVVVRCSNGASTRTNTDGRYSFILAPAPYTVTEIDRVGYSSTTPNAVAVDPVPGEVVEVNYGDVSDTGTGFIHGLVYLDFGRNGQRDPQEDHGIAGVRVFLDTGAAVQTDARGGFLFAVSAGNYTVTEVDSIGYASSTPNIVDVNLAADGDSVWVEFGDYILRDAGEIAGIVYLDEDADGVLDNQESGIANVTVTMDGSEVTQTDTNGEFRFVAEAGSHEVVETDPPDHTSSTVNTLTVVVVENQTTNIEFGDIGQQDIIFQEIVLSQTERALSINAADLKEDSNGDLDMLLGTHYVGGTNDILAWFNGRKNSGTPNSAIFTVTPSYQRVVAADVNAVVMRDLNADGAYDVVTGLGTASNNVAVWLTQTASQLRGQLPTTPTVRYTASGAMTVNDVVAGKFDNDSVLDLAIGTTTGFGTGRVEIWHGRGGSTFTHADTDIYNYLPVFSGGSLVTESLGEVVSLAAADFNRDGIDDLVVGSRQSTSLSLVYLLVYGATLQTGPVEPVQPVVPIIIQPIDVPAFGAVARLSIPGSVHDVLAFDMKEDGSADIDIVIGSELGSTSGSVQVWHNRGSYNFGAGTGGSIAPSDQVDAGGAPLSLAAAKLDNDIFPDLIVGTRRSTSYDGQVVLYRNFGFLSDKGTVISSTGVGEIVTMTNADFNKDGAPDLAAGTRTSATTGKVVVFFNERQLP